MDVFIALHQRLVQISGSSRNCGEAAGFVHLSTQASSRRSQDQQHWNCSIIERIGRTG